MIKKNTEETKEKIQSNLEFLLSQNDILPLLKKLNKDKARIENKLPLDKAYKNVRANKIKVEIIFLLRI